jgi:urocanate hydratase
MQPGYLSINAVASARVTRSKPVWYYADGTDAAAKRIETALWNDPAPVAMRHTEAGYKTARGCARKHGLNLAAIKLESEQHD